MRFKIYILVAVLIIVNSLKEIILLEGSIQTSMFVGFAQLVALGAVAMFVEVAEFVIDCLASILRERN